MSQPVIRRNTISVWATGRYSIDYAGYRRWALTLLGARWAARRMKRRHDVNGSVVS